MNLRVFALGLSLLALPAGLATAQDQPVWIASRDAGDDDNGPHTGRTDTQVLVDPAGVVYVVGQEFLSPANSQFVVLKYDSESGSLLGQGAYNQGSGIERFRSAALYGNYIYVTGQTYNGSDWDYLTVRFRKSDLVADRHQVYDRDRNDAAYDIVVGSDGVWVTGESEQRVLPLVFVYKATTIKYSLDLGTTLYTITHDFGAAWYTYGAAIARDAGGNVYVAGCIQEAIATPGKSDWLLLSYAPNGSLRWDPIEIDGTGTLEPAYECLRDVAVRDDRVYVTGTYDGFLDGATFGTACFATTNGSQYWLRSDGSGAEDIPNALAVGVDGDVWVTGSTRECLSCDVRMRTVHYDVGGGVICEDEVAPPGGTGQAIGLDVASNECGYGVVAGSCQDPPHGDDYRTIEYTANDCSRLMDQWSGGSGPDSAKSVATAGLAVYATGTRRTAGGGRTIVTLKYAPEPLDSLEISRAWVNPLCGGVGGLCPYEIRGAVHYWCADITLQFRNLQNGEELGDPPPDTTVTDNTTWTYRFDGECGADTVRITAVLEGGGGKRITLVQPYVNVDPDSLPCPLTDAVPPIEDPEVLRLAGPEPNPMSIRSRICFDLAERRQIEVSVTSVAGRRVRTLARGEFGVGRHELVWDRRDDAGQEVSGGVYFIRAGIRGGTMTRKLVLVD